MDADRILRMLAAQDYQCALWHPDDGSARLELGQPLGAIDDGTGLVHLGCLKVGEVAMPRACLCGCGKSLAGKRATAKFYGDACAKRFKRARAAETAQSG